MKSELLELPISQVEDTTKSKNLPPQKLTAAQLESYNGYMAQQGRLMTAQTYRSTLKNKCGLFMRRPNNERKVISKEGVETVQQKTERDIILEQLKELGVATYKNELGEREALNDAPVSDLQKLANRKRNFKDSATYP